MDTELKKKVRNAVDRLTSALKMLRDENVGREVKSEADAQYQRAKDDIHNLLNDALGVRIRYLFPRYCSCNSEELMQHIERNFRLHKMQEEGKLEEIVVEDDSIPLIRINAPEFYARKDFLRWLNSRTCATWHISGHPANDMSDAFMYITTAEGSCSEEIGGDGIPEDIFEIVDFKLTEKLGPHQEVLVWLKNINYKNATLQE